MSRREWKEDGFQFYDDEVNGPHDRALAIEVRTKDRFRRMAVRYVDDDRGEEKRAEIASNLKAWAKARLAEEAES